MDRFSRMLLPTVKDCNLPALKNGEKHAISTRLLLKAGFITPSSSGMYAILPLGMRVLESIQRIIDEEMQRISAFKCSLPSLQPHSLWEQTGRLEQMKESMFLLDKEGLLLAPTHEEEMTRIVAQHVTSASKLPLRLYQIGPKFRREQRPKGGLLRLREFIMKDMYSFDADIDQARHTYSQVRVAYARIFKRMGIPVSAATASCGDMGGSMSHEYHLLAEAGEDTVYSCDSCGIAFNQEVMHSGPCPQCSKSLTKSNGIELGHTFLLGTRYTKALGAMYKSPSGELIPMEMGCYGIGVSRLVAAIAESCNDEKGLVWPSSVAPYRVIITGGQSMNTESAATLEALRSQLINAFPSLAGKVAIDDRSDLSLSWRLRDAQVIGVPTTLVLGRDYASKGLIEVHQRSTGVSLHPQSDVLAIIQSITI